MDDARANPRRAFLRAGAATLAAGLLPAAPARAADAVPGGSMPSVTAGLLRNPVAGLIELTDRKGWFRDAGLDFKSVLFTGAGGPKVLQAMGGNSVGLGSVSATAALLAVANRAVPLSIVSIATDPAPCFVVLSAREIQTMPQLAGKRVATTAGTGLHYFLARALQKNGMKLTDIEFVNLPVGDAQAAFLAKRVDAVVPSLNGRYYISTLRPDARELFTYDMFARAPGLPNRFEDYDVFVAPQAFVGSGKPALRAFLAAYHGKGVPYLRDAATRDAAVAEITRYVNVEQKSPADEAAMRRQLETSGFFDLAKAREIVTGGAFRAGLEDQVRFFVDSRQLPASFSLDGLIAGDLLG